jgi:hypothetical protein
MIEVTIGMTIMSPAYRYRFDMFGQACPSQTPAGLPNKALSNTALIRRGFTTPRPAVTTIASPTTFTFPRYGRKVPMTRRTVLRWIGRWSSSERGRKYRP